MVRGAEVKLFATCSPEGRITPHILVDILTYLDTRNIFSRVENFIPHIVKDGNIMQLHLLIVRYMFNPNHRWELSFGYPCGTQQ